MFCRIKVRKLCWAVHAFHFFLLKLLIDFQCDEIQHYHPPVWNHHQSHQRGVNKGAEYHHGIPVTNPFLMKMLLLMLLQTINSLLRIGHVQLYKTVKSFVLLSPNSCATIIKIKAKSRITCKMIMQNTKYTSFFHNGRQLFDSVFSLLVNCP